MSEPELTVVFKAELAKLENRVKKLAADKSNLQLTIQLMNRISGMTGLEPTIENTLHAVSDVIGGVNLILYYWIDDEIFYADVYGNRKQLTTIEDDLVKKVVETRESVELEHEFSDTKMLTAEFTKAYTWSVPLVVGQDLIGVLKMESLHLGMRELSQQLPAFFSYAALILKNEILGQSRLQKACNALAEEMTMRQRMEQELRLTNETLEDKVAARTADLQNANARLAENEKQITKLLDRSEKSRRALLSILEDEKRAQAALQQERTLLSRIMETSPVGITLLNPNGEITFANTEAQHVLCVSKNEISQRTYNMPVWSITDYDGKPFPDDQLPFVQVMTTRRPVHDVQHAIASPDGQRLFLSINGAPILDELGNVESVVCTIQDITERKQAEARIQYLTRLYATLSQVNQTVVRVKSRDALFEKICNIAITYGQFQIARIVMIDEATGPVRLMAQAGELETDYPATQPNPLSKFDTAMQAAIASGKVVTLQDGESDIGSPSGAIRAAHSFAALPLRLNGEVVGALNLYALERDFFSQEELELLDEISLDISFALETMQAEEKRLQAEQALRESEQKFRNFVEQSSEGFTLTDEQGTVIEWNQARERITGLTASQVIGQKLWDVQYQMMPPERQMPAAYERNKQLTLDALRTGESFLFNNAIEAQVMDQSGVRHFIRQTIFPIRTNQGFRIGSVSIDITERKQVELQLLASEQLFRALVENSPDAIVRYDKEGRRIYVNPALQKALGFMESGDLLGKPPNDQASLDTASPRYIDCLQQVIETKTEIATEMPMRLPSGRIRWSHVRFVPEFSADGTLSSVLAIGRDIHEIKENEQRFRTLAESFPDLVVRFDRDYRYTYANPAVEKMFGIETQALIGKTMIEAKLLDEPSEIEKLVELVRRAFIEGVANKSEAEWNTQLGKRIFEIRHVPEKDAGGNVVSMLSIAHDITERKRADEALRASEERFRSFVEKANDLVYAISPNGVFTYVPPNWKNMLGYEISEVEGKSYEIFVHPDDLAICRAALNRAITTGESLTGIEYRVKHKNGNWLWHISNSSVIHDDEGRIISVLGIARDITERKRVEEALRFVAQRSWTANVEEFLPALVQYLGQTFGTEYVAVDRILPDAEVAETVALYAKGQIVPNIQYELKGTPCENVAGKNLCYYSHDVQKLFPEDTLLVDMQADSYIGIPLWSAEGKPIGLIAILDSKPITKPTSITDVLQIVATRAAAELERKQIEQERQDHLRFMESLDRINRAIQGTNDLEQMMRDVLDATLGIFDCDRAFLMYPCDPNATAWYSPMERNKPEYPGILALGKEIPMDPDVAETLRILLAADGPVQFGPGTSHPLPKDVSEQFGIQNFMSLALYPKMGSPWQFGIHQCSHARVWTAEEERLFREIGRRIGDALTSLVTYRDLQESEAKFSTVFRLSPVAICITRVSDGRFVDVNDALVRMAGYTREEFVDQRWDGLWLWTDRQQEINLEQLVATQDSIEGFEFDAQTKSGEPRTGLISIAQIELDGEKHFLSMIHDITERKRAEEAERESAERFRAVTESASEGIISIDSDGKIFYWNQAAHDIFGYTEEEILGKPLTAIMPEIFHGQYRDGLRQWTMYGQARTIGRTVEAIGLRQDNTEIPIELSVGTWQTREGTFYTGMVRNITERKHAEEALRASEARFRALVENSSEIITVLDLDGSVRYESPAHQRILGYTDEEMFRSYPLALVHEEDLPKLIALFIEGIDVPRYTAHAEYRMRHKDGSWRTFDMVASNLIDDPAVKGIVINSHDITERKRAEETLRLQATALQAAANSIIITDRDGIILWVNPAFTKLTGYTAEEAVGRSPNMLKSGKQDLAFYQHLWNTILSGNVWQGEVINRRKNGTLYTEEMLITPVHQSNGQITHFIATKQDVSERKQHENEREAILQISNALRAAISRADMLPLLLDQVNDLFHADGAIVTMSQPIFGKLLIESGRGTYGERYAGLVLSPGEGISGHVIATGKPYLCNDVHSDPTFAFPEMLDQVKSIACAPLNAQDYTIGALGIMRTTEITEQELRLLAGVADIAANAIRRTTLHEQTEQQLRRLTALHQIDTTISSSLDLRITLNVLLNNTINMLGVDAADILLYDPYSQELKYAAGHGFMTRNVEHCRVRLGQGQAGTAVIERRILSLPDLNQSSIPFQLASLLAEERFVSHFVAPLIAKGQVKGALEVFHRSRLEPQPEWLDFLETLATQAAIAIDNATLFDNLQNSNTELRLAYDATIEGWSRALDLRDHETEGHTQRVAEMSLRLARALGIKDEELTHMRRGALLHDIGKMGIPDNILLKAGALTDEERRIMQKHPTYAYELISPIAFLRQALDIPFCHHEKWDGTGYPRGLKGDQIPLAARAFAIVDVWDALRSDRPYRRAWSKEQVYHYIREQSGIHFDPHVVEAFFVLLET
ncbi:MAG: PAS domain S-box protein [Chloroflexi bacterium]|nr:PAS domain S-box protein [Chloroflexota bacterium]